MKTRVLTVVVDPNGAASTTTEAAETLRANIHTLGRSVQRRTDTPSEDQEVAAFVHNLLAQLAC